ncbi:MAG: response regulator, partial [Planctomycetes bacterium]|nr:response regulator [Planctomycetota bacterium]
ILGFAEMLRSEGDLSKAPPKRVEAVDTIIRNGNHLLKVISDILDLSKVEAAKMTVESRECSPWHIVEEAVSSTQGSVEDKGLKLAVEHTFPLPRTIRTDPVRLKQVLINLIGNAVKFTEHGGVRINVRCVQQLGTAPPEKPGAVMQFVVTDTGIGMTEGQMGRVFQPFTQADTGHTRRFGGTGLGLAISKHLAVMLGGDIQVESEPDKGSTFTLTIDPGPMDGVPMLDAPPETSAKEEPTAPLQAIRGRVLLAEDGPDNQRVIAFLLEKAGAEVAVAENGQIAHDLALAARAEGNPFDVILMDMQMPVMDGYAATGKLREAGYTGPIIALTAHAMSTDRDRCLAAGCDDYLTKPIDRKALISTVAEYASAKELLKACDAPVA